jgi:hypothetical protein
MVDVALESPPPPPQAESTQTDVAKTTFIIFIFKTIPGGVTRRHHAPNLSDELYRCHEPDVQNLRLDLLLQSQYI